MCFPSHHSDNERAGRVLAHPLCPLLTDAPVSALAEIASGGALVTADQQRLLRDVLTLLDAAEIRASREDRP